MNRLNYPPKPLGIRVLHWVFAFLLFIGIASGYRIADTGWPGVGILDRPILFTAHMTAGILIACLSVIWLAARVRRIFQTATQINWWHRGIAILHVVMAGLAAIIGFLGWAARSVGGYGQSLFGVIPVPPIAPKLMAQDVVFLSNLHKDIVPYLLALVVFHVLGALFHALVLKDQLFRSMWFSRRS